MKILIESVFLFGVISAKTNPAQNRYIEASGFSLPIPSVFISYDDLECCAPEFRREDVVLCLYEMMAYGLIQCAFVDNGIYASTIPGISEIFNRQDVVVDCEKGPVMKELAEMIAAIGA